MPTIYLEADWKQYQIGAAVCFRTWSIAFAFGPFMLEIFF